MFFGVLRKIALPLFISVLFATLSLQCKKSRSETEDDASRKDKPSEETPIQRAQQSECSWGGHEVKSGYWAEDGSGKAMFRYCLCEDGKFIDCSQSLPPEVKADRVIRVGSPTLSPLSCTWKGTEIGDGRWVEDATAQFRYCKCVRGQFPPETCLQALPAEASSDSVVKIETKPAAGGVCAWKGRTLVTGQWLEDSSAQYRYCQCQDGKFANCTQSLPAGVSAQDVLKI